MAVGVNLLVGDDGSSHFIHAQIELLIADANTQGEGGEVDIGGCCWWLLNQKQAHKLLQFTQRLTLVIIYY